MTPRRELQVAVSLCLLGAAFVLLGVSRTWVTIEDSGRLTVQELHRSVSGATLAPGLRALGWVAMAGVLALAATRRWGRVATGFVIFLVGAVGVIAAARELDRTRLLDEAARAAYTCGPSSICSSPSGFDFPDLVAHPGPLWLCVIGAVLVAVAGALTALRGRDWAGLGSAYEAPGGAPEVPVTDKGVWDALDRGDDPTA